MVNGKMRCNMADRSQEREYANGLPLEPPKSSTARYRMPRRLIDFEMN
jgi:hypothetical protein